MSIKVNDFRWEKGKNDLEYIALLKKNLDLMKDNFRKCSKVAREQYNRGKADGRAKTIEEIEDRLHEVYQMNAYCAEDYCTEDGISCDDCLKVKIYQILEGMKEGEKK